MRIASLGSGSKGNATVLDFGESTILVDCGFGLKETISRLATINLFPNDIDAILVTHEHSDHASGVESFASKFDIPVYMTAGTKAAWKSRDRVEPSLVRADISFLLKDVHVLPVAVPHDAREPVQFVFRFKGVKVGVLTDIGSLTPHVIDAYTDCDLLMIEANHDLAMLNDGPYPSSLKRRVGGAWGHLNNAQTAELLKRTNSKNRLQCLIVGHISEKNNQIDLVESALDPAIQSVGNVFYAVQNKPLDWIDYC